MSEKERIVISGVDVTDHFHSWCEEAAADLRAATRKKNELLRVCSAVAERITKRAQQREKDRRWALAFPKKT